MFDSYEKEYESYRQMLKKLWQNRYAEDVDREFALNLRDILLRELLRCRKNMDKTKRVRGFIATIEIVIPTDDPNIARRFIYDALDRLPPDADGANKVVAEFYGFRQVEVEVDEWGYQLEYKLPEKKG